MSINMSYCQFENTNKALEECKQTLWECDTLKELYNNVNDYEKDHLVKLIKMTQMQYIRKKEIEDNRHETALDNLTNYFAGDVMDRSEYFDNIKKVDAKWQKEIAIHERLRAEARMLVNNEFISSCGTYDINDIVSDGPYTMRIETRTILHNINSIPTVQFVGIVATDDGKLIESQKKHTMFEDDIIYSRELE